jgi:hypothetical protein
MAQDKQTVDEESVVTPPMSGFDLIMDTSFANGNAAVKMQWCIAPDILLRIAADGKTLDDAFIILSVSTGEDQEVRYIFDVKDMEGIVNFYAPGENWIHAHLCWVNSRVRPWLKNHFKTTEERDAYKYYYIRWKDGVPSITDEDLNYLVTTNSESTENHLNTIVACNNTIMIDIDPDYFAPELSPNHEWWVSLWEKNQPDDQCDRRKQKAIAYTVQPLGVGVYLLVRATLILILWLCTVGLSASRGFDWKPFWHPFTHPNPVDCMDKQTHFGSLILRDKDGDYRKNSQFLWIFIPFITLCLALITLTISLLFSSNLLTIAALVIATFGIISWLNSWSDQTYASGQQKTNFGKYFARYIEWNKKWVQKRRDREAAAYEAMLATMTNELTCAPDMRLRDTSGLRSVRKLMLYNRVKQAICKPIPRRRRFRG